MAKIEKSATLLTGLRQNGGAKGEPAGGHRGRINGRGRVVCDKSQSAAPKCELQERPRHPPFSQTTTNRAAATSKERQQQPQRAPPSEGASGVGARAGVLRRERIARATAPPIGSIPLTAARRPLANMPPTTLEVTTSQERSAQNAATHPNGASRDEYCLEPQAQQPRLCQTKRVS